MLEIKEQIEQLRKEISYHANLYYNEDNPILEDSEYDELILKLQQLEQLHPEYASKDSPLNIVGGMVSSTFNRVRHTVRMESLSNAFSKEDIKTFMARIERSIENPEYVVETKVDGLSVNLIYIDGVFIQGATRGDGTEGEDVTENLKTIKSIPKRIITDIHHLEVRGEVYMSKERYLTLTELQNEQGEVPFKNPRNAAAGSLRQKDPAITSARELSIAVFNIQVSSYSFTSHNQGLDYLKNVGFNTVEDLRICRSFEEVVEEIERINSKRHEYDFDIDGAVVKLNDLSSRAELGSTTKSPRWAIAFKYPPEVKSSIITDIEVYVGRTGVLTPVAVFEPIELSGSTVSRASLHNEDMISSLDIRIGDTIDVHKAGDIIPEILRAYNHKPDSKPFIFPRYCISCNSPTVRVEGEAAWRCINPNCPEQVRRNLIHFVSKDAMDIDGMGPSTVDQLISGNYLPNGVASLYMLTKADLLGLDKIKDKTSDNLLTSIRNSKEQNLNRLIFALGIRGVGQRAATLLALHFNQLSNLIGASEEEISSIEGIGPIMAKSIREYFSGEENILLIKRLEENGVNFSYLSEQESDSLEGMTVIVTGTLNEISRDEANRFIESHGGKSGSSVSKRTSYVVAGENAGSKLTRANELGIPVITWEELQRLCMQ